LLWSAIYYGLVTQVYQRNIGGEIDILFLVLIVGIQWEGWLADVDQNKINVIINEIEVARDEVKNKREHERIEQMLCETIYRTRFSISHRK
jgi:hypothetical protein